MADEPKEPSNVSLLTQKIDPIVAANENLRRNMDAFIENIKLTATLRRASFDAHMKAGFTAEQALQMCTRPFN